MEAFTFARTAYTHTDTHTLSLSPLLARSRALSRSPGTLLFPPVNSPSSPALEEAPPSVETSLKFPLQQLSAVPTSGFRKWVLQTLVSKRPPARPIRRVPRPAVAQRLPGAGPLLMLGNL